MKNLPLDVLRAFITVAEMHNVTQAGELLGRSQPAISLQIKRLEQLVETPLFKRNGRQMQLTQAGQELFGYARQIISLNDEALARFVKPTLSGKISFGIPSEFATTLLPKILSRFAQSYPSVTLEVTCDLSKNLLREDNRQRFDLILALHDSASTKRRGQVKTDELVWVSSATHNQHLQAEVPLIVAPEGCIYRNRIIRTLDRIRQPWRIVYTIPDLTGIQAAIKEGLGVTVLAKSTVPDDLQILRPSDRLPRLGTVGISLLYHRGEAGEATLRLVDFVKTSLS